MPHQDPSPPQQLVDDLRDLSDELAHLGRLAERFAGEVRAASLSMTLEAVKTGLPQGRLRDLAVHLREEASVARERLRTARATAQHRAGRALARSTRLLREADVVAPARRRAEALAQLLAERAVALQRLADDPDGVRPQRLAAHRDPALAHVAWHAGPDEGPRVVLEAGGPAVRVPAAGGVLVGVLAWDRLAPVLLSGGPGALAALLLGADPGPLTAGPGQAWLLADDQVIASTDDGEPPRLPGDVEGDTVSLAGRRRIAVAPVPAVLPGLAGWRLVAMGEPRPRPQRLHPGGAEVIPFPGLGPRP